jgi:Mce-associated membrane protein
VSAQETAGETTQEPAQETVDAAADAGAERETQPESDVVSDGDEPDGTAQAKKPSSVRNWLAHNKKIVAAAAVGGFVVAGGFAGAALQPYLADRAVVATKLKVAQTAADAITALWSYTPEDMDSLPDRSAKYLGGGFEEQYRAYVDAIAPTNKQAKVTSSTQVVGVGVESLRGAPEANEATAIVYTNTTSTTPQNNNIPSMKYLSYRLELSRYGRDWRVTKMTTVTSLDLTPKLGL